MSKQLGSQSEGGSPAGAVDALVGVRALDLAGLDDGALIDLLRGAEEAGRVVDAARVLLAGEVARRSRASLGAERLCARYGCRNAAELITRITHVSRGTAVERIRLAEPLMPSWSLSGESVPALFPHVAQALERGELGLDATRAVTRSLTPPLSHGADPRLVTVAEGELVAAASIAPDGIDPALDPERSGETDDSGTTNVGSSASPGGGARADDVAVMAQVWQAFLDPDGAAPDEDLALRRRGITLGRQYRGTVSVRGELLPEVAAQLQRLFDAYLNPRVDAAPPDSTTPHGIGVCGTDDASVAARDPGAGTAPRQADTPLDRLGRTQAQRRHDALAGILTVAAAHEDAPRLGGAAPTLVITVDAEELNDPRGAAFIQGGTPLDTLVGTGVARHVSCSGATQVLTLDEEGRILGLSSPQRVFTSHQRRAITLRDGACVIPGCDVPATWCEIHHVLPHHEGGPTHTDNGVLLCWYHHRTLDEAGWQITMDRGVPQVTAPPWIDPEGRPRLAPGSRHRQWRRHRGERSGVRPDHGPPAGHSRHRQPTATHAGTRVGTGGGSGAGGDEGEPFQPGPGAP